MRKLIIIILLIVTSFCVFAQQKLVNKQTFSNKFLDTTTSEYLSRKDFIANYGTDAYYSLLNKSYKNGEINADELNFCLTDKEQAVKEKIIADNRPVEMPKTFKNPNDTALHFNLKENKVEFHKVYNYKGDVSTIKSEILNLGLFTSILSTTDTRIIGNLKPSTISWKELGLKYMTTSMLATKMKISGFAVIDIKDDHYRISLRNIVLNGENIEITSNISGNTRMTQNIGTGGTIEEFVVNKEGKFNLIFKKEVAKIYEYTIDKLFEPKPINNNW